jgi:hypothetical protein
MGYTAPFRTKLLSIGPVQKDNKFVLDDGSQAVRSDDGDHAVGVAPSAAVTADP